MFNPMDWYWIVNGDESKLYSSKRNTYVGPNDPAYTAWKQGGSNPSRIANEADILYYVKDLLPDWLTDGETFVQPAEGTYSKAQLARYAASVRYAKEVGGTTINGVPYMTDRETQSKLASAVLFAQVNPAITFKWKVNPNLFVDLDATTILGVATAVGSYVQQCFATEATVAAEIEAGTITLRTQIDAAFA